MTLIDIYTTQLRVMWSWKGGPGALIWRFVVTILVAAVAFFATAWIIRDMTVSSFGAAVAAVIVMTLFNAIIRTVDAGTRRAVLIDPDRRVGAGISGSRVSHRGALGAWRQHQRLRRSAHRRRFCTRSSTRS